MHQNYPVVGVLDGPAVSLRPTIAASSMTRQAARAIETGSLKSSTPRIAVPNAPMPTHTAYAVPIGMVLAAQASSHMLPASAIAVSTLGQSFVNPCVYLSPTAQPHSSKPATSNAIHAMMTSEAGAASATLGPMPNFATVKEYLAALPPERRREIEAVRAAIREGLHEQIREEISYNMIGYVIPHSVYPPGYHCNPKLPLPVAALAAQKHAISLYNMAIYGDPELLAWFVAAWKATGKKLDMGKSCVRFKAAADAPLSVITQCFKKINPKAYIAQYERNLASGKTTKKKVAAKPAKSETAPKSAQKATKKKVVRKVARAK